MQASTAHGDRTTREIQWVYISSAANSKPKGVKLYVYQRHVGPISLQYRVPFDVGIGMIHMF